MTAATDVPRQRLLFVAPRVAWPLDRGDRIRSFHLLAGLARRFEIDFVALEGERSAAASLEARIAGLTAVAVGERPRIWRWSSAIAGLLAGRSATAGYFTSTSAMRLARRAPPYDLVIAYSAASLAVALRAKGRARVVDLIDADSAKWRSFAAHDRGLARWVWMREAEAVAELERRAAAIADRLWVVSGREAELAELPPERTSVVRNGVDAEYFRPRLAAPAPDRFEILFTGGLDYRPNVEGAAWFATEVFSRVRSAVPNACFRIVGRRPTWAIRRLTRLPGVELCGDVPDVRPFFERASLVVVPLPVAPGLSNKVLEAMAMSRPVVASQAALCGLDLPPETGVLEADGPVEWATSVIELLLDPARWESLGARGRAAVVKDYRWSRVQDAVVDECLRLVCERRGERASSA